ERFAPVRVTAHVLDGARAPLLVSPQHRFLFTGYKAELLFGCDEGLRCDVMGHSFGRRLSLIKSVR
ncbi:Hint domain-containing protein, partial [Sulfuriflexus sp.]|uniref:Hint domain-containing protein n=1 Tax=Sulfuriflexus sp. TaxID=2015443 RepID=UPI0028CDCC7B